MTEMIGSLHKGRPKWRGGGVEGDFSLYTVLALQGPHPVSQLDSPLHQGELTAQYNDRGMEMKAHLLDKIWSLAFTVNIMINF